jgi:hypothetical protein
MNEERSTSELILGIKYMNENYLSLTQSEKSEDLHMGSMREDDQPKNDHKQDDFNQNKHSMFHLYKMTTLLF